MRNTVELLGTYGGDLTHGLSAWTSTSRELTEEKRGRLDKMLAKLASEGHETPFEKSMQHFLVTADVATHIHILKHRIGVSVNGESARYKEHTEDKFLIPDDWPQDEQTRLYEFTDNAYHQYHTAIERLVAGGMDRKRAKESARFYLPYNSQVRLDVSFNFRSFMHFQSLRNKPDAQREVRLVAEEMLNQIRALDEYKYSLDAFGLL